MILHDSNIAIASQIYWSHLSENTSLCLLVYTL